MPSTYTESLRIELQASGENEATWGDKTNTNLSTVLEAAIAGIATIQMANADYTLSIGFSAADEARNAILILAGGLNGARNVIVPAVPKVYVARNITTGGYAVTIKTEAGTGVTIVNGETVIVFCDGTNVITAATPTADNSITPIKLYSTASAWQINGALGIGMAQPIVANYGVAAINGTSGSYYDLWANSTHIGSINCTPTALDISCPSQQITMTTNGLTRFLMAHDGSATFGGALSAALLGSTGNITAVGAITAGGNVTAFSDERLKKNWRQMPFNFIARMAQVKHGIYERTDYHGEFVGVSAQELRKVLPQAVEENGDKDKTLSVAYGNAALAGVVELCKKVVKMEEQAIPFLKSVISLREEVAYLREEVAQLRKGK